MSAAVAAAAAAAVAAVACNSTSSSSGATNHHHQQQQQLTLSPPPPPPPSSSSSSLPLSRYESQKRRDWNTFGQYLRNHRPPLALSRCSGAHVLEFLRYLDQFGKTKVHHQSCPFFGHPHPPAPCSCPLKQAWGSLDALIGRLRAAFEENGGLPETNPFGARAVRLYLREVRDSQAKARGIAYEKKKRRNSNGSNNNNNNNNSPKEVEQQKLLHRHLSNSSSKSTNSALNDHIIIQQRIINGSVGDHGFAQRNESIGGGGVVKVGDLSLLN